MHIAALKLTPYATQPSTPPNFQVASFCLFVPSVLSTSVFLLFLSFIITDFCGSIVGYPREALIILMQNGFRYYPLIELFARARYKCQPPTDQSLAQLSTVMLRFLCNFWNICFRCQILF